MSRLVRLGWGMAAVAVALGAFLYLVGVGQLVRLSRGPVLPATLDASLSPQRAITVWFREVVLANERSGTPEQVKAFDDFSRDLYWRSERLSDERLTLEFMRALATLENAHSTVIDPRLRRVGLRLHWFSDGLYVVKAKPGLEAMVGTRIVAIENSDPEDLLKRLRGHIPGLPGWQRYRSEWLLTSPSVMVALGNSRDDSSLLIEYETSDGALHTLAVNAEPQPPEGDAFRDWRHVLPGDESFGTQGWIRAGDRMAARQLRFEGLPSPFARSWVEALGAEYLRLNGSNSTRDIDLPTFLDESVDEMRSHKAKNAIVDLRFDWGGDYVLTRTFPGKLAAALPEDGRVAVITGPNTFSAGLILAARLKDALGPRMLVVGEPVGDKLEFWAEGLEVEVPRSRADLYLSTARHDLRHGCPLFDRDCFVLDKLMPAAVKDLAPDVPAASTFADYMAGRDVAMERVAELLSRTRHSRGGGKPDRRLTRFGWAPAFAGVTGAAGVTEEEQVIALERQSWVAWKAHDAAFFERFLSDDHIEVQPYGVTGKAQVVAGVANPGCKVEDYALGDFQFRRLGPDSAMLVYRAKQTTTCFGKPVPSPANVTSVYQRRDGQWFNILFSQTPLATDK